MAHDSSPPWPGFVDALSSVLMMMIFFTLILVLVVATLSYETGRKNKTTVEASADAVANAGVQSLSSSDLLQDALAQKAELGEEDIEPKGSDYVLTLEQLEKEKDLLKKELKASQARITELETAQTRMAQKDATPGKKVELRSGDGKTPPASTSRVVKGMDEDNRIIILYNQLTSILEESNKNEVLKWVRANSLDITANGLMLVAALNLEGVPSSTANSVSFNRLYDLIRIISEEGGIPKSKIKFRSLNEVVSGTNQVLIGVESSTR